MHRPPRPAIKSSMMFPLHPLRRILTPDAFHYEHEVPIQDMILRNMRENALPSQLLQSMNKQSDLMPVEDIEK